MNLNRNLANFLTLILVEATSLYLAVGIAGMLTGLSTSLAFSTTRRFFQRQM